MATNPFEGKVAIVTGASLGIGRATALALAEQGACVALASRNSQTLSGLAEDLRRRGKQVLVITTDVTQQDQVQALVREVVAQWGRVDILVSNAGEYIRAPITELDPATIQRSLNINFFGGVYCVKAVLPHMLAQKSGHIVFVTSMDGKIGLPPEYKWATRRISSVRPFTRVKTSSLSSAFVAFATASK